MRTLEEISMGKIKKQVLQFSSIGAINAVVDIGVLNLFLIIWPTSDNMELLLFNSLAYFLAIANSYYWNSKYTFQRFSDLGAREIGLFLSQAFVAWLVNNLVFIGMLNFLEAQEFMSLPAIVYRNTAKAVAMLLSFTASFFMMKFVVFRYNKK